MQQFSSVFHDKFGMHSYDCVELKDSRDGLEIILIDENDCKLIVRFETHLAYRRIDEGDALLTLAFLKKIGCSGGPFYQIKNSNFLRWFNRESCGMHDGQSLKHYALITMNDVIDVITCDKPIFTR
ncbi:hypothetical protein JD974_16700 [Chromobacterium haemolyticum]|uniref:Uncharacterized protein n=1 Tax=Chromobacterium haemolyticum TaxID=394935 RepID=A0ABS3GPE5_9NEIS|nr:hypothetical protein [Chromobacterium haemolyticum]MBK0416050.1 hypothetical protein [Chromobacterium haemolyticum]MBO0416921.1 hypothetical protein [Chromobacterium haemolyticum]MBO0500437.1 hypothetical protein [Chromobacterium haemolyticum]BBH11424.1 hypothetical protein CH06BL_06720 [Chromobacterium haemolyticum]